jgi:hypothetical protein
VFCVSAVSACPAASRAQIRAQIRLLTCGASATGSFALVVKPTSKEPPVCRWQRLQRIVAADPGKSPVSIIGIPQLIAWAG